MVEVGGIEPPSETLLVRRNYDYVCIIGVRRENLKRIRKVSLMLHCNMR